MSIFRTDDWVSYGGKQFMFVMDAARGRDLVRAEAAAACRSVDAQLVTIDTEDEFEFLKKEIRQRVIGAGQEFAHERWWTAGKSFDKRWVWDRGQYTIPGWYVNQKWQLEKSSCSVD
jgi:hypothetical protein